MVRHTCRCLQKQFEEQNTHKVTHFWFNKQETSNSMSGLDQPENETIYKNNNDDRFINDADSSSEDECGFLT